MTSSSATIAVIAGCLGTPEAEAEEPVAAAGAPTDVVDEPTTASDGSGSDDGSGTESDDRTEAESDGLPTGDLRADPVRSTGRGQGTSDRFTALGGPVVITLTFEYAGMLNANFIVRAIDDEGEALPPATLSINELLADGRLADDSGEYRARLVTRFDPGEYFLDVTAAGGPYGDGEWNALVEQPGVPTEGESLPVTVESIDADVLGPFDLDGPTRITVETHEPRIGATGEPATYNYRASGADATGEADERLLNSVETAPVNQTAVWIPDDGQEVGYVNVHSVGPWTATVEAA